MGLSPTAWGFSSGSQPFQNFNRTGRPNATGTDAVGCGNCHDTGNANNMPHASFAALPTEVRVGQSALFQLTIQSQADLEVDGGIINEGLAGGNAMGVNMAVVEGAGVFAATNDVQILTNDHSQISHNGKKVLTDNLGIFDINFTPQQSGTLTFYLTINDTNNNNNDNGDAWYNTTLTLSVLEALPSPTIDAGSTQEDPVIPVDSGPTETVYDAGGAFTFDSGTVGTPSNIDAGNNTTSPVSDAGNSNTVQCTLTDNGDGSYTLDCEDGTSVTWHDGEDGEDGEDGASGAPGETGATGPQGEQGPPGETGANSEPCTVTDNGKGKKTITCPDGTSVDVFDGEPGGSSVNSSCESVSTFSLGLWGLLVLGLRRRKLRGLP